MSNLIKSKKSKGRGGTAAGKKGWQEELVERFGERVTFKRIERLLYSHDVASLPDMVRKLFQPVPDAVVQPETVEELVFLTRLASRYRVPLVPRGSGTSGYGGSVPARRGIVVEFNRMNRILAVDPQQLTVTTEPGVIIKELDDHLRERYGLSLRALPTSAPGATLGGWIAAGGAGIGSNLEGYVGESVLALEMVLPSGEQALLEGEEVGLAVGLEGVTGFITKITLKLRPAEAEVPFLVGFRTMGDLLDALAAFIDGGPPTWHISFASGRFQALNEDALGERLPGMPAPGPALLLVPHASQAEAVKRFLEERLPAWGGELLPEDHARRAWARRYYPMRLKRLGASLIPSESSIPLARAREVLDEFTRLFGELALEGTLIHGREIAILGFALGDERQPLAYALDFAKSLHIIDVSLRYGGAPYALGLFFTDLAPRRFGEDRYSRLLAYKKEIDPLGVCNPDKALESSNRALAAALAAARLTRPLTGVAAAVVPKLRKCERPLPERLVEDAFACVQCGYCRPVCSLYSGRRWESASPRGKFYFLREYALGNADFDQDEVDTFLMCTTCKRCNAVCQVQLPIQENFDRMRGFLVMERDFATYPAFYLMKAALKAENNIWAALRENRTDWVPPGVTYRDAGELGYWVGCTASFILPDIAQNAMWIFKEAGVEVAYLGRDEGCCGAPMFMSGLWDTFAGVVRGNVEQINKRGIRTLVVSCPGCWVFLNHYYREWAEKLGLSYDVEVRHISEVIAGFIKEGRLRFRQPLGLKATWHDPCHIGRHGGIYEPPREVLKSLPGLEYVEMTHNRANGLCCGSVLTRIKEPTPTSDRIGRLRLEEAAAAGTRTIYTTCPCCEFQLRVAGESAGLSVQVLDFTDAVVEALGYRATDTAAGVRDIWAVFDKVLRQMAVEGMAGMMRDLMPVMLAQLPDFMKKSLGVMRPLPERVQDALLAVMRPLIPKMMPKLMDQIMPKVLPDVLRYMEEKIPDMPPSMRKLLPELLPAVMADMMPRLLPHVLPLVLDDMLAAMAGSLRSKTS